VRVELKLGTKYGISRAYQTSASAEDGAGRDGVQPIDNGCEPLDQLWITIPEFIECPGLVLEYGHNRIGRHASINRVGERVITQILPSTFGVLCQCDIKEIFEVGGVGGCITSWGHGLTGEALKVGGERKAKAENAVLG